MRRRRDEPDATSARERALRALARREHSAAQLEEKLRRRGHTQDDATATVERLRESGLQSDERFAEVLVRTRIRDGHGPQRIRAELEAAGCPATNIEAALAAADCDWPALCVEVHARRFRAPPAGAADWQKQYRFLAGRGFEAGQIYQALKGEAPDDA